MPKATKLHPKGKSTSIQKPCKPEKDKGDNVDPDESMRQFQLELCWCIQQLERTLAEKKGSEKHLQEAWKVLAVLKNNNQPVIRKRQLMRLHFGDYRAKMAAEEKKLAKMANKMKISDGPDKPKATFVRKSAFLTTGDSSFRFNFDLAPEQVDNSGPQILEHSNTEPSISGNTEPSISGNTENEGTHEKVEPNKNFKFTFTNSDFRFNFNVDNS